MSKQATAPGIPSAADMHPYRDELESYARLPQKGRSQDDILRELRDVAAREDARWETGQVSGSSTQTGLNGAASVGSSPSVCVNGNSG